MSAKAIREATGKDILNRTLDRNTSVATSRFASVTPETRWDDLLSANPWLANTVRQYSNSELNYFFHFIFIVAAVGDCARLWSHESWLHKSPHKITSVIRQSTCSRTHMISFCDDLHAVGPTALHSPLELHDAVVLVVLVWWMCVVLLWRSWWLEPMHKCIVRGQAIEHARIR